MAPGNYTTPVATKDHLIVQDDDPAILYTPVGDWYKFGADGGDSGNYSVTNAYLAQFAFTFVGSEIWYYSDVNGDHGNFSVAIDGVQKGVLMSTAPQWKPQVVLYHATLEPGEHTLTVMSMNQQGNVLSLDYLGYRPLSRSSATPSNTAGRSTDGASHATNSDTPAVPSSSQIPTASTTLSTLSASSDSTSTPAKSSSIPLTSDGAGPPPSTGLLPLSAPPPAHRLNKLVYVGIALGITFFLLLLGVAALVFERHRRRRSAEAAAINSHPKRQVSQAVIQPFPITWPGSSSPSSDPLPGYSKLEMEKVR